MRLVLIAAGILVVFAAVAGCAGTGTPSSSYSVDNNGVLSVACAPVTTSGEVLFSNETYTVTKIVMHSERGDVVTYLAAPKQAKAAVVYVPGAGENLAGHEERMVRYTAAGYAFLFVDTRGNGEETPGMPFGPELIRNDFSRFEKGDWPQYYLTICDLITARQILASRLQVPVYAMGSSNGGRYAAVATGIDPQFAGYVGISTSDWGLLESAAQQGYTGDPLRFAMSLEPGTYLAKISPRPVWIFHAPNDPIIPFENGKQFFRKAQDPKTFIGFAGDHGINPDVDRQIMMQWAQIYGTRG